jgi:hypothetical protein
MFVVTMSAKIYMEDPSPQVFCLQQTRARALKVASTRTFLAGILLAQKSAQKREDGGHQTVTMQMMKLIDDVDDEVVDLLEEAGT